VPTPDPGGQARARNVGSRAARGQLLVYCDADDIADPAWLENIVRAATGCGGVGGHLEEELLNDPVVRQWRPPMTNGGLPGAFGRVHVPVGANCAVWRHVFDEVGGFEETLTFTGDEVDFFWRVQLAGHEVRYAPGAVMHYRHRDTLRGLRGQAYTYGRGNVAVFTRFQDVGLPTTSALETVRLIGPIVRGVPRALISRRHRGAWLRMASYFYGQVVESRRRRVWHLG
jgi:GT2 family glycosyltransferase